MAQHVAHPFIVGKVIGSNHSPTPRQNGQMRDINKHHAQLGLFRQRSWRGFIPKASPRHRSTS